MCWGKLLCERRFSDDSYLIVDVKIIIVKDRALIVEVEHLIGTFELILVAARVVFGGRLVSEG